MFLQHLRAEKLLCDHSDDCLTVRDRVLSCRDCKFSLNLEFYFLHWVSEVLSIKYAEKYVEWSGDCSIPCQAYHYFDGSFTKKSVKTTFDTVATTTRLLGILHEPLKKGTPQPSPEDIAFFRETVCAGLRDAAKLLEAESEDFVDRDIGTIGRIALELLSKHFETVRYFDGVVPHVKRIHRPFHYMYERIDSDRPSSVSASYENRMKEASSIHRILCRKSATFDAVQVSVLCYLCRHDPHALIDLVLDFAGRFCRGFHDNVSFGTVLPHVKSTLDDNVSQESNTAIYRLLETIRAGGRDLEDAFSEEFFKTYWQLKAALAKEVGGTVDFCYSYPRVLFRNYADYYAFRVALAHYAAETDAASKNINEILVGTLVVPRGVVSKCKELYRFVRKWFQRAKIVHECFVEEKLQAFNKSYLHDDEDLFERERAVKTTYVWNRQIMKLFLKFANEEEEDIVEKTKWIATNLPLFSQNDPDFEAECLCNLYKIGFTKTTDKGERGEAE